MNKNITNGKKISQFYIKETNEVADIAVKVENVIGLNNTAAAGIEWITIENQEQES